MLNNEFPPLGGGTGSVNLALFRCWAGNPELEIDLITSALGASREEERFSDNIRLLKVPVNNANIHHSSNRELLAYASRGFALAVRLQRQHPYDVCMAWASIPAGVMAWALRALTGLPYIVRVSGPDIPGFEQRYQRLYPFLTPPIRAAWRGARTIIAKCQEEATMVHAIDPVVTVQIVPNGVDQAAFLPGSGAPDTGPLHVLCVARLIERKGQAQLIEATRRLNDEGQNILLELVGTGDALDAYQSLATRLGVSGWVSFTGYVPREQIASHYAAAHVFALPSYNEGMSVATLEALAAGLPIVATRVGGMEQLVSAGENGFLYDWGDITALTSYLRRLAQDRALAREMGKKSRLRAQSFQWSSAAETLKNLLISSP